MAATFMAAPSLFQDRLSRGASAHLQLLRLPHMISTPAHDVVPRRHFTTLPASAADDRVKPVPKAVSVGALAVATTAIVQHSWVAENQSLTMSVVFGLGYLGIIFEDLLAFNKAEVGLLMAAALWVIRSIGAPSADIAAAELAHSCGEVSEIVFYLLGAMTIVEIVDAHQGFTIVTDSISTRKPRLLLWLIRWISFFLSSVLDNLTSTIVMVSLLRKLVRDPDQRRYLGAVVVVAANAGGAWSPVGDVTTTMSVV